MGTLIKFPSKEHREARAFRRAYKPEDPKIKTEEKIRQAVEFSKRRQLSHENHY